MILCAVVYRYNAVIIVLIFSLITAVSTRSELCLPILKPCGGFQSGWEVVGIIDIESWEENHFSAEMVEEILQIGFALGTAMTCDVV